MLPRLRFPVCLKGMGFWRATYRGARLTVVDGHPDHA